VGSGMSVALSLFEAVWVIADVWVRRRVLV
jgi:hypothetical protein